MEAKDVPLVLILVSCLAAAAIGGNLSITLGNETPPQQTQSGGTGTLGDGGILSTSTAASDTRYKVINVTDNYINWKSPIYAKCEDTQCFLDFKITNKDTTQITYDVRKFKLSENRLISNPQFYRAVVVQKPQEIWSYDYGNKTLDKLFSCSGETILTTTGEYDKDTRYTCLVNLANGSKEYQYEKVCYYYDEKSKNCYYRDLILNTTIYKPAIEYVTDYSAKSLSASEGADYRLTFEVPPNTAGKFDITLNYDGKTINALSTYDPFWNSTMRWSRPSYKYALNVTGTINGVVLPINGTSKIAIGGTDLWVYAMGKGTLYYNSATDYDFNGYGFGKNIMAQTSGTTSEPATNYDRSLRLYLPLDEAPAIMTATEYSGYNSDGTATNAHSGNVTAKINKAWYFDGTQDYIKINDPADGHLDFNGNQNYSINAWVKVANTDAGGIIASKLNGLHHNIGYQIGQADTGSGNYNFLVGADGADYAAAITASAPTGNWDMVTGVHYVNGTTRIYMNSVKGTSGAPCTGTGANTYGFIVGIGYNEVDADFTGYIDEISVYSKSLSEEEIGVLYNLGTQTKFNSSSALDRPNTTWVNDSYVYRRPVDLSDTLMLPLNTTTNTTINGTQVMIYGKGDFDEFDYLYYNSSTLKTLQNMSDANALEWFSTNPASHGTTTYSATTDPVLHYPFDEATGNPEDYSGLGHDGTIAGSTVGDKSGANAKVYKSFYFDGNSDNVSFADDADLDFGTGDFTISVWAKPASADTYGILCEKIKKSGNFYGYQLLQVDTGTGLWKFATFSNDGGHEATSASAPVATTWQHIVGKRESGVDYLYVNGLKQPTTAADAEDISNAAKFTVGMDRDGLGDYSGYMDDLRVYPRALSDDEIFQLYSLHGKIGANETQPFDSILPELDWNWTAINSSSASDAIYNVCVNASESVNCTLNWDGSVWANGTSGTNICFFNTSLSDGNSTPIYSECTDATGNAANTSNAWYYIDDTAPTITFVAQKPVDLNITNAQNNPVHINYTVTDTNLNSSSVVLYYKANSTTDNTQFYLNGTAYAGYFPSTDVDIDSDSYNWTLLDNAIYPGTFNTGAVTIDNKVHNKVTSTNANIYVKTQYYNVSGTKQWGYFEIAANSTAAAAPSRLIYCNSTYTTGNMLLNPNCVIASTRSAITSYDHCHTNSSCHIGFQFAINTTSQTIGTVKISSTSYFAFGGATNWNVFNIAERTRAGMTQRTTNRGTTWTTQVYTVDQHLHQFDNSDDQVFYYYVCANDTFGNYVCSATRTDTMEMAKLPPSSPTIYIPVANYSYANTIPISYTAALSPSGYDITNYNISLGNAIDSSFNSSIRENNTLNLGYNWDSTTTPDGVYVIIVRAYDNMSQSSFGYSENFTIDNTHPIVDITNPVANGTYSTDFARNINWTVTENLPDNCSWTDNHGTTWNGVTCNDTLTGAWVSGLNMVTICANDTASNEGNHTIWFYVDATAPKLTWTWATRNLSTNDNTQNVSISANENVTNCWFDLNGTNKTMVEITNTTFYYEWNITTNGNYSDLEVECNDSADNFGLTSPAWLDFDTIVPRLNWTWDSALRNATSNRTDLNITLLANEALSACELEIAGVNNTMTLNTSTSYYYEWNMTTEGNRTLEVECNDSANNTGINAGEWYRYANYTGEVEATDIDFVVPAASCQDATFAVSFNVTTNGLIGNFTSNITTPAGCNYMSGNANYANNTLGGTPVTITSNFLCFAGGVHSFDLNISYVNNTGTFTENATDTTLTSICSSGGGGGGGGSTIPIEFYLIPEVLMPQNEVVSDGNVKYLLTVQNNGSSMFGDISFEIVSKAELSEGESVTTGWCKLADTTQDNYYYKSGEVLSSIEILCDMPPIDTSKQITWVERVCVSADSKEIYKKCAIIEMPTGEPLESMVTGMSIGAIIEKYWIVAIFAIAASAFIFLLIFGKKKKHGINKPIGIPKL